MKIGEALRKERIKLGLTQDQMCAGILSRPFYARIESGKNRINAESLFKILLEHQVDLVEFCDLIQDDYTSEERKVEKQFEFKMNLAVSAKDTEAYGTSFSGELVKKHQAGVTRVRYYGNGNFNLYLSKSMLNKIRSASYGVAFGIISGLIGSAAGVHTMGLASGVIAFIAKKLVGAMLGQVNPYKVGRVYKIRNWKYAGWRYQ